MDKTKVAQFVGKAIRVFNRKAYYDFLLNIFATPPKAQNKPSNFSEIFDVSTVHLKGENKKQRFTRYKKKGSSTVILFAHGWGGSIQNFKYFIPPALERNLSIMGFDAPAHGASKGKKTHILEFKETIKYCLNEVRDYERIIVIGHSLGAAAATLAILDSTEVKVDYLFALAAPSDLRKIFDEYVTTMNVPAKDVQKIHAYVRQKIQLDFDADNWRKKQIPDHLANVMLLHGKKEEVIPVDSILGLAKDWGLDEINDVRLLDDIGHYNILKSTEAIEHVFSKID